MLVFSSKQPRYYSLKRQSTSTLPKKQNPISPNDRIRLKHPYIFAFNLQKRETMSNFKHTAFRTS